MKKYILILVIIFAAAAGLGVYLSQKSGISNTMQNLYGNTDTNNNTDTAQNQPSATRESYLGNTKINLEVADTAPKQTLGLSGRNLLPQNQGLLFPYSAQGYSIWMKNMKFPIDIIWLESDFKVVEITKAVSPDTYPQTFTPKSLAPYVIEVNSGWSDNNNIKIGDRAIFLWVYQNQIDSKQNLIKVDSLKIGDKISSPITITGQARGNWYFEASFPVKIIDAKDNALAIKPAMTTSDWMTTEFVPFSVSIEFTPPPGIDMGFVVLQKDNPSGLPQYDDQIQIPILFR